LFSWHWRVYQKGKPDKDFSMSDDIQKPALESKTDLPAAATRALAEAEERRKAREAALAQMPIELGGREGPEPVRYGDWEKKGLAIDF